MLGDDDDDNDEDDDDDGHQDDINGEDDNDDGDKQAEWLTLHFCPVTDRVTEWIESSRLNQLF